jgi:hypothetical protein
MLEVPRRDRRTPNAFPLTGRGQPRPTPGRSDPARQTAESEFEASPTGLSQSAGRLTPTPKRAVSPQLAEFRRRLSDLGATRRDRWLDGSDEDYSKVVSEQTCDEITIDPQPSDGTLDSRPDRNPRSWKRVPMAGLRKGNLSDQPKRRNGRGKSATDRTNPINAIKHLNDRCATCQGDRLRFGEDFPFVRRNGSADGSAPAPWVSLSKR